MDYTLPTRDEMEDFFSTIDACLDEDFLNGIMNASGACDVDDPFDLVGYPIEEYWETEARCAACDRVWSIRPDTDLYRLAVHRRLTQALRWRLSPQCCPDCRVHIDEALLGDERAWFAQRMENSGFSEMYYVPQFTLMEPHSESPIGVNFVFLGSTYIHVPEGACLRDSQLWETMDNGTPFAVACYPK